MAFRASNVVPQEAYRLVKSAAVQLKVNLQGFNTRLASSGADYDFLQGIYLTLTRADAQFDSLKATAGLAQYAKDQENDPAYDVAAEFTALQASMAAATAWMVANVPTNVTAKSPDQWDGGVIISTAFTAGQTGGLQTALQAVIDGIS